MSDRNVFRTPDDEIERWMSQPAPPRRRQAPVTEIRPRIEARRETRTLHGADWKVPVGRANRRR